LDFVSFVVPDINFFFAVTNMLLWSVISNMVFYTVCSRNYVFWQSWLTLRYMTCKFLGFSSGVVKVLVLLGCGAASVDNRCTMLWDHYTVLKHRAVT
jgi:hypothetical protein